MAFRFGFPGFPAFWTMVLEHSSAGPGTLCYRACVGFSRLALAGKPRVERVQGSQHMWSARFFIRKGDYDSGVCTPEGPMNFRAAACRRA